MMRSISAIRAPKRDFLALDCAPAEIANESNSYRFLHRSAFATWAASASCCGLFCPIGNSPSRPIDRVCPAIVMQALFSTTFTSWEKGLKIHVSGDSAPSHSLITRGLMQ